MSWRERFLVKVNRTTDEGHWYWMAAVDQRTGYGRFTMEGKTYQAHRLAWELSYGAIPPGMLVLHKCDERLCVNPLHLKLGTHVDNAADMVNRDRCGRFTKAQRAEICRRRQMGETLASIAADFSTTPSHIRKIVLGLVW